MQYRTESSTARRGRRHLTQDNGNFRRQKGRWFLIDLITFEYTQTVMGNLCREHSECKVKVLRPNFTAKGVSSRLDVD
jgi:hypothetical protein